MAGLEVSGTTAGQRDENRGNDGGAWAVARLRERCLGNQLPQKLFSRQPQAGDGSGKTMMVAFMATVVPAVGRKLEKRQKWTDEPDFRSLYLSQRVSRHF